MVDARHGGRERFGDRDIGLGRHAGLDLREQAQDPGPAVGSLVEVDVQVRDPPDAQRLAELVTDEWHRVLEGGDRCIALGGLADDADPHLGVAQVLGRLDRRDRREPDPRIRDITSHDHPDLLPQKLVDAVCSLAHVVELPCLAAAMSGVSSLTPD
jgi:hypothetical protein